MARRRLLLWGFLVVSTVDNVIRPLVISGAGRIPFLVVLFGVLGGLSAFGAIGLFLGPVILAVLLSVWQAWLKLQKHEKQAQIRHPRHIPNFSPTGIPCRSRKRFRHWLRTHPPA